MRRSQSVPILLRLGCAAATGGMALCGGVLLAQLPQPSTPANPAQPAPVYVPVPAPGMPGMPFQFLPGQGMPAGATQPGGFRPPRRGHFEGGTFYYDEPEPVAPMGGFAGGGFQGGAGGGLGGGGWGGAGGMQVPGSGFKPKRPGHFEGGRFVYDTAESQVAPKGPAPVLTNPTGKVRALGGDGSLEQDFAEDVRQLLNPLTTPGTARELLQHVTALGLEAIPLLLPYVNNRTRYGDDALFQGFEAPRTPGAITVTPREATVGDVAALVAYHAIRPRTPSPYERAVPGKHHRMFVVADLRAFYVGHAGLRPLDVADEMGGYVDRYFQQAGTPPTVKP